MEAQLAGCWRSFLLWSRAQGVSRASRSRLRDWKSSPFRLNGMKEFSCWEGGWLRWKKSTGSLLKLKGMKMMSFCWKNARILLKSPLWLAASMVLLSCFLRFHYLNFSTNSWWNDWIRDFNSFLFANCRRPDLSHFDFQLKLCLILGKNSTVWLGLLCRQWTWRRTYEFPWNFSLQ